jgi:hypothetical protein
MSSATENARPGANPVQGSESGEGLQGVGTEGQARRFAVGISYPGERRDFVKDVAAYLAATFGRERVLYDRYHEAELARPDLDVYLPNLYRADSELLVVFLCHEYPAKRWCTLEWRSIRQLIATLEANRIMLFSFGDPGDLTQIGILPGDGYIDIAERTAEQVARTILERHRINGSVIQPAPAPVVLPTLAPPVARVVPTLSFAPVNRKLVSRQFWYVLTVLALALAGRMSWEQPVLMKYLGLSTGAESARIAFEHSILLSLAAFVALVAIWIQLLDTQLTFSVARALLLASALSATCGAVRCLPGDTTWTHSTITVLGIVVASFFIFFFGLAGFYWRMRSFGDVALEVLVFAGFLWLMWKPIAMLFRHGVVT